MDTIERFDQVESLLKQAAFLIGQQADPEAIHDKIISALLIIGELKNLSRDSHPNSEQNLPNSEAAEAAKVKRRLKLWARRPDQINHQILRAFLYLHSKGHNKITAQDLYEHVQNKASFKTNLIQMKTIAEKNHGKVFEQVGDTLMIWPPVESDVLAFWDKINELYSDNRLAN